MTKKEATIVELLRRYEEAQEGGSGDGPGDGRLPLMPSTWNGSYRELERCLKRMRRAEPSLWWHVTERYIRTSSIRREVPVRRPWRNGLPTVEFVLPPHCELAAGGTKVGDKTAGVRLVVWNPGVELGKVRLGVEWLAREFRGEPFLPLEFVAVTA